MLSFLYEIYREQRYLAKISNEELCTRLEYLIINLIELDFNGAKIFYIKHGKLESAFISVLEEHNLRDINYTTLIKSALLRFENHVKFENYPERARQIRGLNGNKCLFKFTKKKYMESLIKGEIRLKLASAYKADGLNIAIHDDELNIIHRLLNARMITKNGIEIPVKDDLIKKSAFGDYYMAVFQQLLSKIISYV